jgi:hypothetical protein
VGAYSNDTTDLDANGVPRRGFLLDRGRYVRLDFPGSVSSQALDINDRGQVSGDYQDADGVFHGYVWERGACGPSTAHAPGGPAPAASTTVARSWASPSTPRTRPARRQPTQRRWAGRPDHWRPAVREGWSGERRRCVPQAAHRYSVRLVPPDRSESAAGANSRETDATMRGDDHGIHSERRASAPTPRSPGGAGPPPPGHHPDGDRPSGTRPQGSNDPQLGPRSTAGRPADAPGGLTPHPRSADRSSSARWRRCLPQPGKPVERVPPPPVTPNRQAVGGE